MNKVLIASIAFASIANVIDATWVLGTGAAASTVTIGGGGAALGLLGGLVIIKGLILGAALLSSRGRGGHGGHRRGKRSLADDNDEAAFAVLANAEPAQCFRRMICDLAAGAITDNDNIISLFNNEIEVDVQSPKYDFATAAKVGKLVRDAKHCELRYSCPLSTTDIQQLLN